MTDAKLLAIRTNTGLSGYLLTTFLVATTLAYADTPYEKPPKELAEILNAPPPPTLSVSPSRDYAIVLDSVRHPSIEELS